MLTRPLADLPPSCDTSATTAAVQNALDTCGQAGGGVVALDVPGTWITDGLRLRSHVTLRIDKDVVLQASGREEHYIQRPGPFELVTHDTPISIFIYGKSLVGASITGAGTIDASFEKFILPGQGVDVTHLKSFEYPRPMTVYLEDSRNTELSGISITGAPFWTVHLVGCVNTWCHDMSIHNEMRMPNTDGFDIDRSTNTLVERCSIITGDDAVCPKLTEETARYGDCENLVVRDCQLESQSSAIKFGSSSFGSFRNAEFERIRIQASNRGIAFQLRDRGAAEHIRFRDITVDTRRFAPQWWGSGEPIYVTILGRSPVTDMRGCVIRDVEFRNVTASSDNSSFVFADDGASIENVRFVDCHMKLRHPEGAPTTFDLRPRQGADKDVTFPAAPIVSSVDHVTVDGRHLPRSSRSDESQE